MKHIPRHLFCSISLELRLSKFWIYHPSCTDKTLDMLGKSSTVIKKQIIAMKLL